MGERKVLNKYHPPDFDPSKLARVQRPKNKQSKARMMLSMSIRCNTCGNYMYEGTKSNSREEVVQGETYLGIKKFRFYFKCSKCSAESVTKTDPQNSDYVVEAGATRNFEPWRNDEDDKEKRRREPEDAMMSLEKRSMDSKREMDILAALDEIKSIKSRNATVSLDEMLENITVVHKREKRLEEEEEDEAILKSVVFQKSKDYVRRIHDDDDTMSSHLSKRPKLTQDDGKPTHSRIKIKSPTVRLSVVKKPVEANVNNSAKPEKEEDKTNVQQ